MLSTSGEVLGVGDGAPSDWLGTLLHEREGLPAALREAARAVVAEARRGDASLAKARVDVAELEASVALVAMPALGLRRMATDVRALLRYATNALERQAKALDVRLVVTVDADVPAAVLVDPEKVGWAISALVGNAMRFVRRGTRHMPGGSIAVKATCTRLPAASLRVAVEDDGPGIEAEVLDRLFKRPDGAPHATGLALTVVRDIVEAHAGSMEIATSTDEFDHGTTVALCLPLPS
jgi:signal transduction histidine kinase